MKINSNLIELNQSSTLAINELSKKLESQGKEIFKFGLGQSPFPIPKALTEELKKNAHQKDYLNTSGLFSLREAVAKYHSVKNKYNYNASNVMIGPGSKELIFQCQIAISGSLLLPSPSWVSYEPQAKILNKKVFWLNSTSNSNWHLNPEILDEFCHQNKNFQKTLILNSPNNPSGTSHEKLEEFANIAKKHNLIIISDEIYAELDFSGQYKSITHFYPEGTIISSGLSKWCGAGGWRLGTLVFPDKLLHIKEIINSIASETFTSVSAPIQYASIKAYTENHEEFLKKSRNILKVISDYIYNELSEVGIKIIKPQGGFYMICDFSDVILKNNQINDSVSLCNNILSEIGFAMLPGVNFGIDEDLLISRIAFVDFDGSLALKNYNKIDKPYQFLNTFCPKIVKGVSKLKDWISQNKK